MCKGKKDQDQTGSGVAMVTLIESIVSVTTRHNDNAPIATDAATAWDNRGGAADAGRLPKPAVPGDRLMVKSFYARANHPLRPARNLATIAGNIAAAAA
jgi:hypothetical protein